MYMKTFNHNGSVILVGGSLIEKKLLSNLSHSHPVYAADSGANFLLEEKINFEAVIGDMDSINIKIIKDQNINKLHITDQDTTDLQKCFMNIEAKFFIGFGFLDLRLDHTLASLTAINGKHSAQAIILVGEIDTVVWAREKWSCKIPKNTRISIWPLGNQSFYKSVGLKYPLDNLKMDPVNVIGTSNETTGNYFSITPKKQNLIKYITILPTKFFINVYNSLIAKDK